LVFAFFFFLFVVGYLKKTTRSYFPFNLLLSFVVRHC